MTTQEGNNAVVARHLEALANAAKDYTLAELANITVGGASYALATTVSSGLMSATDKAKLDNLTNYTLPTASTTQKGGVIIGDGLQMDGDTLNVTLQSGSSGGTVLNTVPATVDGGFWFEMFNDKPVLKMHKGDYNYVFENSRIQRVTRSENLVAWLRFNQSATYDECGIHTWEIVGSPTIGSTNSFNGNALQVTANDYVQCTNGITLGGRDFTTDCWFYNDYNQNYYTEIFYLAAGGDNYTNRISMAIVDNKQMGFAAGANWTLLSWDEWKKLNDIVKDSSKTDDEGFNYKQLHCAYVYRHALQRVDGYLNGLHFGTFATDMWASPIAYPTVKVGFGYPSNGHFVGTISEFRIHDGVALWTENFTPPAAADYA